VATTSDWQVLLTADGAVLSTSGGATSDWIGTRLADRADLPDGFRQAARSILAELHGTTQPMAATRVTWAPSGSTVHLMAIEAIPLRRVSADLRGLLEAAIETMRGQAAAIDVAISLHVDDDHPATVFLDAEKIAWAVTALIGNALRYVKHGSRLMPGGLIAVRSTHHSEAPAVSIAVQDDGPGIPPDRLQRLFERPEARQLSPALGLLMVRDIAAAHGGRLDIQSATEGHERGTTVRLTLPLI
jgi:light-regulated signal transduction histidine kinase (bacteriophytochrome)